jgi:hypothetical protein
VPAIGRFADPPIHVDNGVVVDPVEAAVVDFPTLRFDFADRLEIVGDGLDSAAVESQAVRINHLLECRGIVLRKRRVDRVLVGNDLFLNGGPIRRLRPRQGWGQDDEQCAGIAFRIQPPTGKLGGRVNDLQWRGLLVAVSKLSR